MTEKGPLVGSLQHMHVHTSVGCLQRLEAYRDREGTGDVLGWARFDALEGGVLIVDDVLKEAPCSRSNR